MSDKLPKLINVPKRIWLNTGERLSEEYSFDDNDERVAPETVDFIKLLHDGDITWCQDEIDEGDIEYVRATPFDARAMAGRIGAFLSNRGWLTIVQSDQVAASVEIWLKETLLTDASPAKEVVAELRAEIESLKELNKGIINTATLLMGGFCERHNEEIRQETFDEFVAKDANSCSRCLRESDASPSVRDILEDCELIAHDTGDGWVLGVDDSKHDCIAYLKWPESWPQTMTAADLMAKGFIIV